MGNPSSRVAAIAQHARRSGILLATLLALAAPFLAECLRPAPASALIKGVVTQGALTHADAEQMRAAGVRALRFSLYWGQIESKRGRFDWTRADRMVKRASEAGAEPIPVLYGVPGWIDRQFRKAPIGAPWKRRAWRRFVRRAVRRYGPGGKLAHRGFGAVHRWQVWNEPNIYGFWRPKPSPRRYAELLSITAPTIRRLDRRAEILGAGLAPATAGIRPGRFLRTLLGEPGVRRNMDIVAVHPYARSVAATMRIVGRLRKVLDHDRARGMPMMITEVGWSDHPASVGEGGQVTKLERLYRRAGRRARSWRIAAVLWYAWQDIPDTGGPCDFCSGAGLVGLDGDPKQALDAFTAAR